MDAMMDEMLLEAVSGGCKLLNMDDPVSRNSIRPPAENFWHMTSLDSQDYKALKKAVGDIIKSHISSMDGKDQLFVMATEDLPYGIKANFMVDKLHGHDAYARINDMASDIRDRLANDIRSVSVSSDARSSITVLFYQPTVIYILREVLRLIFLSLIACLVFYLTIYFKNLSANYRK
jgi:hypothetical protein